MNNGRRRHATSAATRRPCVLCVVPVVPPQGTAHPCRTISSLASDFRGERTYSCPALHTPSAPSTHHPDSPRAFRVPVCTLNAHRSLCSGPSGDRARRYAPELAAAVHITLRDSVRWLQCSFDRGVLCAVLFRRTFPRESLPLPPPACTRSAQSRAFHSGRAETRV